jgi:hypothetical protein
MTSEAQTSLEIPFPGDKIYFAFEFTEKNRKYRRIKRKKTMSTETQE